MNPNDTIQEKVCTRCLNSKEIKEFINSRKVIGKYCNECLSKRRKYFNEHRCDHGRMKINCKACKLQQESSQVKPIKEKAKIQEVKVDDEGNVNIVFDRLTKREKVLRDIQEQNNDINYTKECAKCSTEKPIEEFLSIRGKELKTCSSCRMKRKTT